MLNTGNWQQKKLYCSFLEVSFDCRRCTLSVNVTQPSVNIQLWIEEEATFDSQGNPNIKSEVYEVRPKNVYS